MAFAHDTHRASHGISLFQRALELRAEVAERVAKYRLYRATVAELNTLTERELNDLGLTSGDIASVAHKAAYAA